MSAALKRSKNIIEKIKRLLMNYDLSINYAQGELDIRHAEMNLYSNETTHKKKNRRYIVAKVEAERFEIFIEELQQAKAKLLNNVYNTLENYTPSQHEIIKQYFLENKPFADVVKNNPSESEDAIKKAINDFSRDMITFYI